jgi:hypothetical protein
VPREVVFQPAEGPSDALRCIQNRHEKLSVAYTLRPL